MAVVNTNISASIAQAALIRNDRDLASAMKLSTGKRSTQQQTMRLAWQLAPE